MSEETVLRDRSKIKKPILYVPKVDSKLEDDISVDSDWDDEEEIDKIEIKEEDIKYVKEDYEYNDFVVPDDEIEYDSDSDNDSDSYKDSDSDSN